MQARSREARNWRRAVTCHRGPTRSVAERASEPARSRRRRDCVANLRGAADGWHLPMVAPGRGPPARPRQCPRPVRSGLRGFPRRHRRGRPGPADRQLQRRVRRHARAYASAGHRPARVGVLPPRRSRRRPFSRRRPGRRPKGLVLGGTPAYRRGRSASPGQARLGNDHRRPRPGESARVRGHRHRSSGRRRGRTAVRPRARRDALGADPHRCPGSVTGRRHRGCQPRGVRDAGLPPRGSRGAPGR